MRKEEVQFFKEKEKDVFNVKYPGGESRIDIIKGQANFLTNL